MTITKRNGRPGGRWVHFTTSPIVGFGDDGPASRLHHGGSSEGSQTKLISDEQMDVLVALGALIALLVISAIVVWIYASRT